jgi:predicted Holliday junction resolvase-like endonuclease
MGEWILLLVMISVLVFMLYSAWRYLDGVQRAAAASVDAHMAELRRTLPERLVEYEFYQEQRRRERESRESTAAE